VPGIAQDGGDWFRAAGTVDYPGTVMLTLSGAVRRPGVYEVVSGASLAGVIAEPGGGAPKACRASCPAGTSPDGSPVGGAGAHARPGQPSRRRAATRLRANTVVPETVCGLWQAARLLRFFADESAASADTCELGTAAMADALERVARGRPRAEDLDRVLRYATR